MAQNFAMDLDSVFGLGSSGKLIEDVQEKKKVVNDQSAELAALEAKLKAMEERLEEAKPGASLKKPVVKDRTAPTAGKSTDTKPQARKPPKAEEESEEDSEDDDDEDEAESSSDDTSAEENPKHKK